MKLTSVEHIGRSQLILSVGQTKTKGDCCVNIRRIMAWWLAGGIGVILFLATLTATTLPDRGWLGYLGLALDGNSGTARVAATEPANHCRVEYEFAVGGVAYRGSGPLCSASIDDNIAITYLPANPRHSCIGQARDALLNEWAAFLAGGVLFPPIFMLGVSLSRRRAAQKREAAQQGHETDQR